jgi:DNA polymerase I
MPNQRLSFYTKRQSKALLDRLTHEREVNFDYVIVDRDCDLDRWVERIQVESCFITLDTETKGLRCTSANY